MTERLPLFPLGTVLFPGLVLPLHIFEPRYRTLVADLVALPESEPRRFGVVAIRAGREVGADGVRALHAVGCTAELRQVQRHEDGRYDIVAFFGIVMGAWLLKFVLFIVLAVVLRDQPWIDPTVLFVTLVAGVIGTLVIDLVVVAKSRMPYVSDIALPGDDQAPRGR